ncbi:AsnC family protein [Flammeovirga agarivorans]|uniref:AsnC family protein n=1 Tax=Flammeovirga agarivorans TaxID=2726742 RepID=A0A7X8XY04_9BACT|nr:AsnC family protein [Flammeovirga agarivorans]NLR93575.1 AsnC family protein [Flammeovirga agarivorans]
MIAILTADIVSSTKTQNNALWSSCIEEVMDLPFFEDTRWDIFRGDSFQIELSDPSRSLFLAILLRVFINAKKELYDLKIDVRISIGIGKEGYEGDNVMSSDGHAYKLSGRTFDKLQANNRKLMIATAWDYDLMGFQESVQLIEHLISNWSFSSFTVGKHYLLGVTKQKDLAELVGVSQPAIHKRIQKDNMEGLINYLNWFSQKILLLTS